MEGRKNISHVFIMIVLLAMPSVMLAQNQKVKLTGKNITLKMAFAQIEKQTGLSVDYDAKIIDVNRVVNIKPKSEKISTVMTQLLSGTDCIFRITKSHVIILAYSKVNAQSNNIKETSQLKMITGSVVDENGQPIIGATIQVAGVNRATVSDINGRFNLEAPSVGKLVVSFIGYVTKSVQLSGNSNFKVFLSENVKSLDEVVVVGYGTMKKSDINAAIVSIKPENLAVNSAPSLTQMLSGKAAGLTILGGSAQPGGGAEVLIRGAASVGAGNEPLYVIDGFPVSNTSVDPGSGTRYSQGNRNILNSINPNDIASIEVLKDASATAIYGARGCNGVILITTKRGGSGLNVEYSSNYSVQTIAKRPEMLSNRELMQETNNYLYEEYLIRYKAYPYGTRQVSTLPTFRPRYSDTDISSAIQGTDWYGLITQTGRINQHNVSINKGKDDTKIMFSLNYFDQKGVIKTSGLQRISGRLNLDQKLSSWFDYGISLTGSVIENQNAALGGGENENSGIIQSALQYSPNIKPVKDENGEYLLNPSQALIPNPLSFLDINDNTTEKRWLSNAFANIHFDKYSTLKFSAGMDDQRAIRKTYLPKTFMYGKGQNGVASINNINKVDYMTEATFTYNRSFNNKHKINGILGYSYQQFNVDGLSANTYSFFTDAFLYNRLSVGEGVPTVDSWRSKSVMASYFGRAQYSLKDRYLFTFTARVDGSDKFGKNNKYGFFPSGAFAWRVSEEKFMQSQKVISDLKLRLSLGQTGNSNIGNNAYEYYAANGRNYYLGGIPTTGVGLIQLANPDLKWETSTELNLGLDFGFFKNRISGSVEVFKKQISDLLSSRRLMSNSILGSVPANVGKTESKGFELSLSTRNLTGPFKWNSNFTMTAYRDRWLERSPDVILQPYESKTDPLRSVYGFIADGIMQPGETVPSMPQLIPGQMKIKDLNTLKDGKVLPGPDGKIDVADMVFLGVNSPDYTMGLENNFSYRNFDLSFFLYSSVGALGWSHMNFKYGTNFEILKIKDGNNFLSEIKDRWSSKNMNSQMPSGMRNPYLLDGQYAHEDASFLRMKNITLGYDLKGKLIKTNHINKCRLYVDVQNVFTLTKFSGLDPEVEDNSAPYPLQRTFSVGLNLSFN